MNIFIASYTPPEHEDDLFMSAHATREDAVRAVEADAKDNGNFDGWRWGNGVEVRNEKSENVNAFMPWDSDDIDTEGHYDIEEVRLHGAVTVRIDRFRCWSKTDEFIASSERRCVDGKVFVAALIGVEDHPKPPRRRKAVRA